jgi:hypothetical protein
MLMPPSIRKLALTAHVISSIGWVGALAVFLAHGIVSVTSQDLQVVRAACIAMGLTAWFVILPFSLASLTTGVLQALGTTWGLLRHYWVVVKLLLTLVATSVLLLKLAPISSLASAATALTFTSTELLDLKASLLAHAAVGLLFLLCATVLAIYKPAGITARGAKFLGKQHSSGTGLVVNQAIAPRWVKAFAAIGLLMVLVVLVILHGGHGPGAHVQHGVAPPPGDAVLQKT